MTDTPQGSYYQALLDAGVPVALIKSHVPHLTYRELATMPFPRWNPENPNDLIIYANDAETV